MIRLSTLYRLSNYRGRGAAKHSQKSVSLKSSSTQLRSHLCNLIDTNWCCQSCHVPCSSLHLIHALPGGMFFFFLLFLTWSHLKSHVRISEKRLLTNKFLKRKCMLKIIISIQFLKKDGWFDPFSVCFFKKSHHNVNLLNTFESEVIYFMFVLKCHNGRAKKIQFWA